MVVGRRRMQLIGLIDRPTWPEYGKCMRKLVKER